MKTVQIIKLFLFSICIFFCNCIRKSNSNNSLNDSVPVKSETQITSTNNSNFYNLDTSKFELWEIDIDRDGDLDKIYSHKFLENDSLYVFKNKEGNYELSLNTYNFSEGGLYKIDSICAINDTSIGNFVIYTHFNGSEGMKRNIFFKLNVANEWIITLSYIEILYPLNENTYILKEYSIKQNLLLNRFTNWYDYRTIDMANDTECIIEKMKIK